MGNQIDPFDDDFEFKPLTDGLGFHKKAEKIKTDIKSSQLAQEVTNRPSVPDMPSRSVLFQTEEKVETRADAPRSASQSISDLIASLPPSLDFLENKEEEPKRPSKSDTRPQIFQPIAREEYKSEYKPKPEVRAIDFDMPVSSPTLPPPVAPSVGSKSPAMPAPGTKAGMVMPQPTAPAIPVPKSSPYSKRLNESFAKAFPHMAGEIKREEELTTEAEPLHAVPANLAAGILDGMVVTGVSTILLVAILAITKVNLVALLTNAQTDGPTQMHLALLFLAVLQMYMLTARSFFGASLGEWAFDMQLGDEASQRRPVYPLLVAWRTLLVTITGLVVLPILSLIFRRDLLKYATGLQLYRRI